MNEITKLTEAELKGENVDESAIMSFFKGKNIIAAAQSDFSVGDIEYNFNKAKKFVELAEKFELSAIVFPELFLIGYPLYNLTERFPLIVEKSAEFLQKLANFVKKTKVLIGFYEKSGENFYNSVAILADGKIEKIIRKNFDIKEKFVQIKDKTALVLIGDEIKGLKLTDDVNKPDMIISCYINQNRDGAEQSLNAELSNISKKYSIPLIYANCTGAVDCISFMGASKLYDNRGKILARAKSFEEQLFLADPFEEGEEINEVFPLPRGLEENKNTEKRFSFDYEYDLERIYLTIINSIREYFSKNGLKRAVLGVSGGLDSSVCAVLLTDAIGAENVYAISMPSKITSAASKTDAKELCENLGVSYSEIPIAEMFEASKSTFDKLFCEIEKNWEGRYEKSFTNDNIQARSRATILWGASNEFGGAIPIATSDKSEAYMGYATVNGDMSGGFAPIADVTKTKLFALARWMNVNRKNKNAIPISIINKRPGAELAIDPKTGKPLLAEDALMPYEFLDEVIWRIENLHQTKEMMMKEVFVYEEKENITKEQKSKWIDKFFKRLQTALYKWSIMPPAPIIDAHSINRAEYVLPVTSKLKFY